MGKKISIEKMTAILEVESLGLTISESARMLGMNFYTLNSIIKRYELNWRGQRQQAKPSQKASNVLPILVPVSCIQSIQLWDFNDKTGKFGAIA